MSQVQNHENGDSPANERVNDEDGSVDKRIKRRIQSTRERIDKAEEALFVGAHTDPQVQIAPQQQVAAWSTIVKQYIRSIEPLLQSEEIPESQHYYEEVELGTVTLSPPDTDGYRLSLVTQPGVTESQLRQSLGLPRTAEIPKPVSKQFNGLRTIIEGPAVIEQQWSVTVDDSGAPPSHKHIYPHAQQIVPKEIYENAVREADLFLQNAGFGLEIDDGGGDHGFTYNDILQNGPPGVDDGDE